MVRRALNYPKFLWVLVFSYAVVLSLMLLTPHPWSYFGEIERPAKQLIDRTLADYSLHGLSFSLLAILVRFAHRATKRPTVALCLFILISYSIATELLQILIPSRSCHGIDVVANLFGLVFGWYLLPALCRPLRITCTPREKLSKD